MPQPLSLLSPEALDIIATTAAILRRRIYAQDGAADASQITAAIMPVLVSASLDSLIQFSERGKQEN